MTERAGAPKKLPGWVYGGLIGCAIIMSWMGWNKYRPATAAEMRVFRQRIADEHTSDCIRAADRIYATRVAPGRGKEWSSDIADYEAIAEPIEVPPNIWEELKELLISPRSYELDGLSSCSPTFGIRIRTICGEHSAEIWICLRCGIAHFQRDDRSDGSGSFSKARTRIRKLATDLYPGDPDIAEARH